MNRLISYFAKIGVFADLLTILVIVVGIISAVLIKREVFPNISYDLVSINTTYPGSTAKETEKLITNPIEQELKEVDGIKKVTSVSKEGFSHVLVQLDPDETTETKGRTDIKEVVDQITNLPEDADDPVVKTIESKLQPIIQVAVSGNLPDLELREIAKEVEKNLEEIPEVAKVNIQGLRDQEIKVEASLEKLSHYQLSLDHLILALKQKNISIPGGSLQSKTGEILIRTVGEFETVEDIKNTVIRSNELAKPILIKDIANVYLSLEKTKYLYKTDGTPSLQLMVLKKEKADAIKLVNKVKLKINEIKPSLNPNVNFSYVNDSSYYIKRRIKILTTNLAIGLTLILIVLTLILPFRVAILVSIGVPFGFLGTLALFHLGGVSLSLLSLMGLIIVSGMLVDDAVVVTDNSVRLIEEGHPPNVAAIRGAQQVWPAITASVLTTVFAFLPMLFMSGIFGKFVFYIPLGVIVALLISLIECYFILPHHISRWIKVKKRNSENNHKTKNPLSKTLAFTESFWENKVVPGYVTLVKKILRYRYITTFCAFLFFGFSLYIASTMKLVLFPPEGIEVFMINMESKKGTSIQKNSEYIKSIETVIKSLPKEELKNFVSKIGIQQANVEDPNTKSGTHYAQIIIYLTPEPNRNRNAKEIIDATREKINNTPNNYDKINFARVNPGPPVGKPISIGVRGKNYEDIMPAINEIRTILAQHPGVSDLEDTYLLGKEEYQILINDAEASASQLSVRAIGTTVRAAYEGIVATSIRKLDEEIPIRVTLPEKSKSNTSTIESLRIANSTGYLIPLGQVATIKKEVGMNSYEHESNQRQVRITGEIDTELNSSREINNKIREILPELKSKHPKVSIFFGGEDFDTEESLQSLLRAFLAALAGVFLILVLTFKSLTQPFLVLFSIPLGVVSVIWTFYIHGMPFSFMGLLGIIALGGVIVNNSIVFVDFVNQNRDKGMNRWESILVAARMRIRPIFLTTVTTVAGLLPTAYGLGGLDKFVVPVAMALGWGVLVGSVLTTLLFPTVIAILDDVIELLNRFFLKRKSIKQELQAENS